MKNGFIKVGAYTPTIKVCDTLFNANSIIEGVRLAEKERVKVLSFPALCLTGATCGDTFYSTVLLDGALDGLKMITEQTKDVDMLIFVGLPIKKGNLLYNVGVAIFKGEVLGIIPKTYLKNYNECADGRYFSKPSSLSETLNVFGKDVPFCSKIIFKDKTNKNLKISVELGEDLFVPTSPSVFHTINGANLIINLSATAETVGKAEYKRSFVKTISAKLSCGYILSDAGEGESSTDMVFGGHNVICENGKVLNESKLFKNGLTVSEIDVDLLASERSKTFNYNFEEDNEYVAVYFALKEEETLLTRRYDKTPFVPSFDSELSSRAEMILTMQAMGLKKRLLHTNAKTAVIGLSGGLDSTLALIVTVKAFDMLNKDRKDIINVTMPCFGTTGRTFNNSVRLAKAYKTTLKKIEIKKAVKQHFKDIGQDENNFDVTFENSQARERTQILMDVANMTNGMVIGTGDLSELALGFATYNGDHMSMYGLNASIPKTLVRHLVEYVKNTSNLSIKHVLSEILDTPVSPELLPTESDEISQKTEEIVGPYILHDFFLYNMIRFGFSPKKIYRLACYAFDGDFKKETIKKWLTNFTRRFFNQQFKRSCLPDGVKVGTVTLSPRGDWKMPSDACSTLWLKELEELK